ncbi:MAG: DASH family cryptochrome [Candidatus Kapaibacterium sp.]
MLNEFHVGRAQRLADNPRLVQACQGAEHLVPVYDWDLSSDLGPHRAAFLLGSLASLQQSLRECGSDLLFRVQPPSPEVQHLYRQSETLYHVDDLPMTLDRLPGVFTSFRRDLERHAAKWQAPVPAPVSLPPLPPGVVCADVPTPQELGIALPDVDTRSAFPFHDLAFAPSEQAAQAHLTQYLHTHRIDSYKATRNGLIGTEFSSKFSPWLAFGIISARTIAQAVREYEREYGANDGTYWLWFELVWRDFFAFRALTEKSIALDDEPHNANAPFRVWCQGATGCRFVDAAMVELSRTGWMGNRMRQIAASYLIHELQCPWQWGEWWFAKHLIDYDPASNEGNWRYIAGQGADPRGGRRFSIEHQQQSYDPDGQYVSYWLGDAR